MDFCNWFQTIYRRIDALDNEIETHSKRLTVLDAVGMKRYLELTEVVASQNILITSNIERIKELTEIVNSTETCKRDAIIADIKHMLSLHLLFATLSL